MSKNIFEESTQDKLVGIFGNMTKSKEIVKESTDTTVTDVTTPVVTDIPTVKEPQSTPSGITSKFDDIFNQIVQEGDYTSKDDDDDCDDDCKCHKNKKVVKEESDMVVMDDEGGEYEEEKMVSVPELAIKELVAYLDDPMGYEGETDVDDVDFQLPEEGTGIEYAKNKMSNTTEYGNTKQKNKEGTSVATTGKCPSKVRTGKAEYLSNIFKCYMAKGSPKQKNDTSVGDTPTNK